MPPRAWEWNRRLHWGPGRSVSLDWGTELWNPDISIYESSDAIREAYSRIGRPADAGQVLYQATSSLMNSVVDAAGGIEYALLSMEASIGHAQTVYDNLPDDTLAGSDPMIDTGLAHPSLEDAWYSLEHLLIWARTLDDRLRRKATGGRKLPDQGLIPALAPGVRRDAVVNARSKLLNTGIREARFLSGLSLHMQSIIGGSKSGRIVDGRVIIPFPDEVLSVVDHRHQLTYESGRDALKFAQRLFSGVEQFMDEMFSALELHLPERFRQIQPEEAQPRGGAA